MKISNDNSHELVLHCDCDNYFAAVEEKFDPALREVPFAVCGDPEMRHSVVMAKNSLAKKAGVPTGISYRQARQICPRLRYVKADISKYLEQTKLVRAVFKKYGEPLPYGMDEAWIDLGKLSYEEAGQIAELIRIEIMYSLGLSASLGLSYNYLFSKIGSDYKKPNAVTVITKANFRDIIWPLPAGRMLFVGGKREELLRRMGILSIGDIAQAEPERLGKALGKVGHDLWRFANGDDRSFNPALDEIGSIGNTITPPADLRTDEEAAAVLYMLATSVSERLRKHGLQAACISISMRDSKFNKFTRRHSFPISSNNTNYLFNQAHKLFTLHYNWQHPLRSLGLRAEHLHSSEQLTLFPQDLCELNFDIDIRIKRLIERYGVLKIEDRGALPRTPQTFVKV